MRMRHAAVVAGLALGLMSGTANAAYLFQFSQTKSGVVETGSGSINTDGLLFVQQAQVPFVGVGPSLASAAVGTAGGDADLYLTRLASSQTFGPGSLFPADSGEGPFVSFGGKFPSNLGLLGGVAVPTGYKSGTLMHSSAFFAGQTFDTIGLTVGAYAFKLLDLNSSVVVDTITVQVGTVPLPASAPLFGAALVALGAVGYGVKRKKAAAAA